MKIAVIKSLIESHDLAVLKAAEDAIMEEQTPSIDIEGTDEGERLTHVLAAIWIKTDMQKNGLDLKTALRNYTQKVRTSIS